MEPGDSPLSQPSDCAQGSDVISEHEEITEVRQ